MSPDTSSWPSALLRRTKPAISPRLNGFVPPTDLGQAIAERQETSSTSTIVPSCCVAISASSTKTDARFARDQAHRLGKWHRAGGGLAVEEEHRGAATIDVRLGEVVVTVGERILHVSGPVCIGLGVTDGGSVFWKADDGTWTLWLPGASPGEIGRLLNLMNPRPLPRNSIIAVNGNEYKVLLGGLDGVGGTYRTVGLRTVEVPSDRSFIRKARNIGAALRPEAETDSMRLSLPGPQRRALEVGLAEIDDRLGLDHDSMQGRPVDLPPSYSQTYTSFPDYDMLKRTNSTRSFVTIGKDGIRQLDDDEIRSDAFVPMLASSFEWLVDSMWSLFSFSWLRQPSEISAMEPCPSTSVSQIHPRPVSVIYVDSAGQYSPVLMPALRTRS